MTGYDQDPSTQWYQGQAPPAQGQPQWNAPYQTGPYQGGPYPGGPYPPQQPTASIKTYRAQAVIILLCCILFGFLPLITGVPALIYSSRVTESISRGDFAKAVESSRRARMLCWISLGLILLVLVIIIAIAAAAASHSGTGVTGSTGVTGNTGANT